MTCQEFSDQFDLLYNNISSNQAPGLDEYEKSVFLTKAQDEIIKSYFNPRLNKSTEGFDGNERRQIDFSMILRTASYNSKMLQAALFDNRKNTKRVSVEEPVMMFINEFVDVLRYSNKYTKIVPFDGIMTDDNPHTATTGTPDRTSYYIVYSTVYQSIGAVRARKFYSFWNDTNTDTPDAHLDDSNYGTLNIIDGTNYGRIPFEDTIYADTNSGKYYAFIDGKFTEISVYSIRLTVVPIDYNEYSKRMSKPYKRPLHYQAWRLLDNTNNSKASELIVGPNDLITNYSFRYIKRPNPIIVADLSEIRIEGISETTECELDPILHPEILQRAVELAKAAWQGGLDTQLALGANSETNMGIVQQSRN